MIADLGLAHCTAVGESGGKKKIHESAEARHRWQSERPSAVFRSTQCQRQKKACTRKSKSDPISLAHADAGYESKACLIPPGSYETATSTNMVGLRGRCLRGEQLVSLVPHGHWKTITFVAGLRHDGIVALFVIDGAMNGPTFLAYVERCLAPTLGRRDIVIMDNLPAHKMAGVAEAIEAVGASVLYLPSYSPDLNPIELFFTKLKVLLRKAAERTIPDLWRRNRSHLARTNAAIPSDTLVMYQRDREML